MPRSGEAGEKGAPKGPLVASDSIENAFEDLLKQRANASGEAVVEKVGPPPDATEAAAETPDADAGDFTDEQTFGYDELAAVAAREAELDALYQDPQTWEAPAEDPEADEWERQTLIGVGGVAGEADEEDSATGR